MPAFVMRLRSVLVAMTIVIMIPVTAQSLTYGEWQARSAKDARLLPGFKGHQLTPAQKASNLELVRKVLEVGTDRRTASDHLVGLGRQHLVEGDLVSAMYRFNHAWLVDSTNASGYHGFGLFFLAMDRKTQAVTQFALGLERDSTHVPLLRDMASTLLAGQYELRSEKPEKADTMTRTAVALLKRAHARAPEDAAVLMKLTVCHAVLRDCEGARAWMALYLASGDKTDLLATKALMDRECPLLEAPGMAR